MSQARHPHQVGAPIKPQRVVVVRKTTTFEQQGLRPDAKLANVLRRGGLPAERIIAAHEQHVSTFDTVVSTLQSRGLTVKVVENLTRRIARAADLVITVGGDGTFLRASHRIVANERGDGAPMMGVNSAVGSSVGFFCCSNRDNFPERLDALANGELRSRGLWRMRVYLNDRPLRDVALNDVLVAHVEPAETTSYTLEVDGNRQRHKSSGVWIATAAGSTGAIRSAGGQVIPLAERSIQYRVRELFPLSVSEAPLIGGIVGQRLVLVSHIRRGMLYIDGAHRRVRFGAGDRISFEPTRRPLPWIAATDVDARREEVVRSSNAALAAAGYLPVAGLTPRTTTP